MTDARKRERDREYARERRRKNPDLVREQQREWRCKNRERALARQREWKRKHPERVREQNQASKRRARCRNPELVRARALKQWKNWARRNPERVRAILRKYAGKYHERKLALQRERRRKNPDRDYQFEQSIRHLPSTIKEMRRVLLDFKRWLKANGYTFGSIE
jgi:ABC-type nitrate/sulfonate/bicarbonate transport system substrate-binding protein